MRLSFENLLGTARDRYLQPRVLSICIPLPHGPSGPIPHVGGPVISGTTAVLIGFQPAARVGDSLTCVPAVDSIAAGEPSVRSRISPPPASEILTHGGVIIAGCPTVLIGSTAQGVTLLSAAGPGTPFCEECEKSKASGKQQQKQTRRSPDAARHSAHSLGPQSFAKATLAPGDRLRISAQPSADFAIIRDKRIGDASVELSWDGSAGHVASDSADGTFLLNGQCQQEGALDHGEWFRIGDTTLVLSRERHSPPRRSKALPSADEQQAASARAAIFEQTLQTLRRAKNLYAVLDAARDDRILTLLRESPNPTAPSSLASAETPWRMLPPIWFSLPRTTGCSPLSLPGRMGPCLGHLP